MADYSPQNLLDDAKALYGESVLRGRVAVAGDTTVLQDAELLRIANTVVSAVRAAAQPSVGWPLPGVADDMVTLYRAKWPDELLQRALELFNVRSYSRLEIWPDSVMRLEKTTGAYFTGLSKGQIGLGIGTATDTSSPEPSAARNRKGQNLISDGGMDNDRLIDTFSGPGWDWA